MDDDGPFIRKEIHQNVLISKVGWRSLQAIDEPCLCSLLLIFAGPPLPTKAVRHLKRVPGRSCLRSPFQVFLSIERLTESSEMSRIINALWISPRTLFTLCEINQTQNFNNFNNKGRGLREKSASAKPISFFRSSLSLTSFNYTRKLNRQHGIRWVNANRNKKVDKGVDWIVPVVLIKINKNEKRLTRPGRDLMRDSWTSRLSFDIFSRKTLF